MPQVNTVRPKAVHSSHEVLVRIKGKGFKRGFEVRSESDLVTVVETRYEAQTRMTFLIRVADTRRLEVKGAGAEDEEQPPEAGEPEEPDEDTEGQKTGRRVEVEFRIVGDSEPSEPFTIELIPCSIRGMSVIPAGKFLFGSDEGAPHERPQREIELPTFACGLMEVSNADYLDFLNYVQETGDHSLCHPDEPPHHSHIPDRWDDKALRVANLPVTGVDWYDAYAFAAWKGWRLPSEEEWEKAARGTEGASYPWGEEEILTNVIAAGVGVTMQPVWIRSNARNTFGLYNAAGNVWEWTAGDGPDKGQAIIRGGSFRTELRGCRTFVRNWLARAARRDDVGFRCVADLKIGEEEEGETERGEKKKS